MNNIREVQRVKSECDIYPDKIIVYYFSGRKREYFDPALPKTVRDFIADKGLEHVERGNYYVYR